MHRVHAALGRVPLAAVYAAGSVPVLWFVWLGFTGGLGPEPISELEHRLGKAALWFLTGSLAITPLRRWAGLNLLRFRRALGLLGFTYVALHLAVWLWLDLRDWALIGADLAKRPYIMIGMAGFALLLPLALSSTDASIRRLGPKRWRQLHWLAYPAILAGAVHYVMLSKGWQVEPLAHLAAILAFLGARLGPARRPGAFRRV